MPDTKTGRISEAFHPPVPEPEKKLRCEFNHVLYRYYSGKHIFQMLCPSCDADLVEVWMAKYGKQVYG